MTYKYYVRTRDGLPSIIYRTTGQVDGDSFLSRKYLDWTPDTDDSLLGMLVKGDPDLDNLDPADVDATIASIRARPIAS